LPPVLWGWFISFFIRFLFRLQGGGVLIDLNLMKQIQTRNKIYFSAVEPSIHLIPVYGSFNFFKTAEIGIKQIDKLIRLFVLFIRFLIYFHF